MMALEDMKALLDTTGYPVVYNAWPEGKAPSLPYICFLTAYSNNFGADDVVYTLSTTIKSSYTQDTKTQKLRAR